MRIRSYRDYPITKRNHCKLLMTNCMNLCGYPAVFPVCRLIAAGPLSFIMKALYLLF